jgi:sugar porter (SP) family MFS transporter
MTESPDSRRRHRTLLRWALSAALGGFVFGYQIAVISGALLFVRRDFGLGDLEQGVLVSVLPLAAMAGGLLGGRLADALGRRGALLALGVVLLAGTALAAAAPSFAVLVLARAIAGAGVGGASATVPLYLSEIAPPAERGRIATTNQLMVVTGILAAFGVNLALADSGDWRAMLALGLVPVAALLGAMLRAPETPVWLAAHGRAEEARRVVAQVAAESEAERVLAGAARERRAGPGLRELARSVRPALVVALGLAVAQQLSGINAIVTYAPQIMERTGLSTSSSILTSVVIGVVNLLATIVAIRLVDRLGRRPLLLGSLAGMAVSLALLGLSFTAALESAGSWLPLVCLLGFVASFAVGAGPVFWVLVAEVFPPDARAAGVGVATAVNWFCGFLVGLAFLPLAAAIGDASAFWVFAAVSATALVFVARYVPETRGRAFAEIDAELRRRWGEERRPLAGARGRPTP